MKKLLASVFLSLLFVSCNSNTEYKPIKVKNKFSLELPDFLSEAQNLNPEASLQYQNPLKEFYVIVLDEPRSNFPDEAGINLEGYKDMLMENLKANLESPSFSEERDTVINGLKAKLFSLTDKTKGLEISYKFAYIESKNNFYQILTWTLANRKDKFSADMDRIIASFKEIEGKSRAK